MKDIIKNLSKALKPLSKEIKEVYIFGSFARGSDKYNDIDVLIVYENTNFDVITDKLKNVDFGREAILAPRNGYYDPIPSPPKPTKTAPYHLVLSEGNIKNNPSLFNHIKDELVAVPLAA